MDYKTLMGYGKKKNKESKPKENKVLESIKDEFNLNEGPAYEYKKHSKKIDKSLKDLQNNYLDFYESLRKKFSPYCSVATWYLWRSIDDEPIQY